MSRAAEANRKRSETQRGVPKAEAGERALSRDNAGSSNRQREEIAAAAGVSSATAQREFVLWWDGQDKQQGARGKPGPGRGHKTASRTTDAVLQLGDIGMDRDTVSRWRKRLTPAIAFERTKAGEMLAGLERYNPVERGTPGPGRGKKNVPHDEVRLSDYQTALIEAGLDDKAGRLAADRWQIERIAPEGPRGVA